MSEMPSRAIHEVRLDRLLDREPLPLEMGYERLANGILHVACRTDLPRCKGQMLEWWFRSRPDTRQYRWWHPVDHISSAWREGSVDTHIGAIHQVEERFGQGPTRQLLIQLCEPAEFFSAAALQAARQSGDLAGLVCGRGGESWQAPRTASGQVLGSRLFHLCRDTAWGTVLRSHYYLGWDLPAAGKSPTDIVQLIPEQVGPALLQHCYSEFMFLSRFLPSLFVAENRDTHPVDLPW